MGGNVAAVLGKGTKFGFKLAADTDYKYVDGIEIIPATSNAAEPKAKTTVCDTRIVYGVGLKDSPDIEISAYLLTEDTDQVSFLAACNAGTELDIQIELSGINKKRNFKLQPLGVNDDAIDPNEWIKFMVPCKQNTDSIQTDLVVV